MNRLARLINEMSQEDLKLIQKDFNDGHIEKLINKRIHHFEEGADTMCPVCHTNIDMEKGENYSLFFGTKDFMKKASFCATDCLEHFVKNLKSLSKEKIIKGEYDGAGGDDKDL